MENGKQPIHPCTMQRIGENEYRLHRDNDPKEHRISVNGLTKREYFAAMAMQGILAASLGVISAESLAKAAVGSADALLKALES